MKLKNILLCSFALLPLLWSLSDAMTKKEQIANTGLLFDDETILISTLDGSLIAVAKSTGRTKWILQNEPVIQSPSESSNSPMPSFFPNPQDGSLYRYVIGRDKDPLKKLPFTIPELVANSPCRSSDGIFYLGKKVDSWVGVDPYTGRKQLVLGMDAVEKVCPKPSRNTVYIGRTMYNIILYEQITGHKWNVTFYHYSANPSSASSNDYDLLHYSAAGQGSLMTIDNASNSLMWNRDFPSPVVSLYLLTLDGSLTSLPLTTVAPQTLNDVVANEGDIQKFALDASDSSITTKLSPTLFLGESAQGVYALPALVDDMTATISFRENDRLLEGPGGQQETVKENTDHLLTTESPDLLLLGYYDVPNSETSQLGDLSDDDLQDLADGGVLPNFSNKSKSFDSFNLNIDEHLFDGFVQITHGNMTFITSSDFRVWLVNMGKASIFWVFSDTAHAMMMIILALIICMFVVIYVHSKRYARLEREVSSHNISRGSNSSDLTAMPVARSVHLPDGEIQVGKISFQTSDVLGKGCDGTFVFRGKFENRDVAVKRILREGFQTADREVELLRDSDECSNVIRLYCMEECSEFRYIALELCSATLDDFVSGKFAANIKPVAIMHQITVGLHHLHTLEIVHRDIKPSNVLLSKPSLKGEPIRAMISDFGLCRRLESGKVSFSKRSGVIGTEGWIAPEMIKSLRPTTKVDIFSLGCVYYYILSKGQHPFDTTLNRQSNIISGIYSLDKLSEAEDPLAYYIVEKMISSNIEDRPPTAALLKYPMFWSADLILHFFLDVSDRVEKENSKSLLIRHLESNSGDVVRGGWLQHLHHCISADLTKFRIYNNRSVRALLRALRNKKNHYRELSPEVQSIFGNIPNDFVHYWKSRFPLLLLHTYVSMQNCKPESIFTKYYCQNFNIRYKNFPLDMKELKLNDTMDDLLDSALGPLRKGPKSMPKMEVRKDPLWKTPHTFEPHYNIPQNELP